MKEFGLNLLSGVLGGIIANAIFAALVTLFIFKSRTKLSIRGIACLIDEFIKPGGVFFYSNREKLKKALGPVDKYILSAQKELIYIGIWFDGLLELNGFGESILKLANNGVKIKIYLLKPDCDLINQIAQRSKRTPDALKQRIENSQTKIGNLKGSLISTNRQNIEVVLHDRPINAAFFIFDRSHEGQKILVDHSIINADDEKDSYGFEVTNEGHPLFRSLEKEYNDVLDNFPGS